MRFIRWKIYNMDIEKTIREYLPSIVHMSLATTRGNKPWVCEVHYVYDDELNLYFCSKQSRRHSLEIADNSSVAGNIVKQHAVGEKVRGAYFEGSAELLDDVDEHHPAFKLYDERFGNGKEILEKIMTLDAHKFYKITVNTWYIFDSVESSPSQKYELEWKQI